MAAPKIKPETGERLWEPLDRPGVWLTEAEVEAEEDAHDIAVLEDHERRRAAGEVVSLSLDEMVEQGFMTEDEARLFRYP